MRRTQRGVTAIGWVFLLIPMAIVGYAGIRLVPLYLNYMSVVRGMEQTAKETRPDENAQGIRFALEKHLDVDGVTFPAINDFVVRREGPSWVVEIEYEDGVPLVSNVQVAVSFKKSVRVGKGVE